MELLNGEFVDCFVEFVIVNGVCIYGYKWYIEVGGEGVLGREV